MFIDIHAHAYRKPEPVWNGKPIFSTPEQVLARHIELGIDRAALLPLVGPEVYLPQSNEDILEMAERWPDCFIPFCNIDPRALRNSPDTDFGELLRYYKDRGCRGFGEFMPNMPFRDPMVRNMFKQVEAVRLPLTFDISTRIGGTYGLYDDPGLPQLEETLQEFPDLMILGHGPAFWAEIGQLENHQDRAGYPSYPVRKEGRAVQLLRRYGNLWGDLSAMSGYNALARDPQYAVQFLNEFQDRLLFGTDLCMPDAEVPLPGFLLSLRDEKKISETVFKKIALGNAVRLLGLNK